MEYFSLSGLAECCIYYRPGMVSTFAYGLVPLRSSPLRGADCQPSLFKGLLSAPFLKEHWSSFILSGGMRSLKGFFTYYPLFVSFRLHLKVSRAFPWFATFSSLSAFPHGNLFLYELELSSAFLAAPVLSKATVMHGRRFGALCIKVIFIFAYPSPRGHGLCSQS